MDCPPMKDYRDNPVRCCLEKIAGRGVAFLVHIWRIFYQFFASFPIDGDKLAMLLVIGCHQSGKLVRPLLKVAGRKTHRCRSSSHHKSQWIRKLGSWHHPMGRRTGTENIAFYMDRIIVRLQVI